MCSVLKCALFWNGIFSKKYSCSPTGSRTPLCLHFTNQPPPVSSWPAQPSSPRTPEDGNSPSLAHTWSSPQCGEFYTSPCCPCQEESSSNPTSPSEMFPSSGTTLSLSSPGGRYWPEGSFGCKGVLQVLASEGEEGGAEEDGVAGVGWRQEEGKIWIIRDYLD